jgi:hypothetical protein
VLSPSLLVWWSPKKQQISINFIMKLTLKKQLTFAFTSVLVLSLSFGLLFGLTTSGQAQMVPPSYIPNFKCGPALLTYKAQSLSATGAVIGTGMRCVKPTLSTVGASIHFAWYGEGYNANCSYRILGQAIFGGFTNSPTNTDTIDKAVASDIWGNGECRQQNFSGNILINTYSNLNTIKVTGALTELWTKVPSLPWNSFPRVNTCGNPVGLDTYKAIDGPATPIRSGAGIRCVLIAYYPNTTWFGNGYWNIPFNKYSELGTKAQTGFGTSSIVGGNFGIINVLHPYGSFTNIFSLGHIANLSPTKDERWY